VNAPAPFAPTGRFGVYDAVGNAPLGFNVAPLVSRWLTTWMRPGYLAEQHAIAKPNNSVGGNMSLFGGGAVSSGGFDWGGLIGSIGSQVAGIYQTKAQNKTLRRLSRLGMQGGVPAGYSLVPSFSGVPAATGGVAGMSAAAAAALGVGGAAALLPELGDLLPGGLEEGGTGLFGPDLFAVGASSRRQRMIDAVHPTTGERVYWRPVGRPIMFTGDAALLKRTRKTVRKMSSQAGCGFGGRTFRRKRR